MALDGLSQSVEAGINSALADAVAVGVTVNAGECAGLADGEHEVVKLALLFGDHGGNGAERVTAGGVFVWGQVAGVWQTTCTNTTGDVVVVVGVGFVNGEVGDVSLLFFDGHEAQHGVGDLLLIKLWLAGLVEIAGGLAKLFVDEIIKRLVNSGGASAQTKAVEGTGNAGAHGVVLVNAGLEGQPSVLLAGGDDFTIPLAGGRLGGNIGKGSHRKEKLEDGAARVDARPTVTESRGDCLRCLGLGAAADASGVIAGILLVRVGAAAQAELAARVLPRLALTIPVETKLRELLPNLGGGLLFELNPNPLPDYLRQAIRGGQLLV